VEIVSSYNADSAALKTDAQGADYAAIAAALAAGALAIAAGAWYVRRR